MRLTSILIMLAGTAFATPTGDESSDSSIRLPAGDEGTGSYTSDHQPTLEKRAMQIMGCQNPGLVKPCELQDVAVTYGCKRIPFSGPKLTNPNTSFSIDRGIACKMYNGVNCEEVFPWVVLSDGVYDLLRVASAHGIGKGSGVVPGYYSFKCWKTR